MDTFKSKLYLSIDVADFVNNLCEECSAPLFHLLGFEEGSYPFSFRCGFLDGSYAVVNAVACKPGQPFYLKASVFNLVGEEIATNTFSGFPFSDELVITSDDGKREYVVEIYTTANYVDINELKENGDKVQGFELGDKYCHVLAFDPDVGFDCAVIDQNEEAEFRWVQFSEIVENQCALYEYTPVIF